MKNRYSIKIIFLFIIFLIMGLIALLIVCIYSSSEGYKVSNEPCRIWKTIAQLDKNVNSEEESKTVIINFLNLNNVTFNENNVTSSVG